MPQLRNKTIARIPAHSKPLAVDLFAGAGGATVGLRAAGFSVVVAVENHPHAAATYKKNHPRVQLLEKDIRAINPRKALSHVLRGGRKISVLNSCPPCQGFSSLHRGSQDRRRNDLVLETARWARALQPEIVILENVPALRNDGRYKKLLRALAAEGYTTADWIIDAVDIGAPQRRKRLILLACRNPDEALPESIVSVLPLEWPFERDAAKAIRGLGRAGSTHDPLHIARRSSALVRERLAAIPIGGNRFDLPSHLRLECHDALDKRHATGSYGRIPPFGPCGTLTTRCTTPACGPFVHPRSARGISLREAAVLQTFPKNYKFVGHYESIERQIGNAVPPRMTAAVAYAARRLL